MPDINILWKKRLNNKKGQIYVVVAILICSVIVGIFSASFNVKYDAQSIELKKLCTNFKSESGDLINTLILNKEDVLGNYNTFAKNYYVYAKSMHYNYGFLYVLSYRNSTYVANFLDNQINLSLNNKGYSLQKYPLTGYGKFTSDFESIDFDYASNSYNYSKKYDVQLEVLCIYKKSNGDLTIVV